MECRRHRAGRGHNPAVTLDRTTPPARRTRYTGVLVNLALAAVSLSLSLVAAEAGARLLTRTCPSLLVADPVVGKRLLAGFASRVYVPECDCEVEVRTNRDGLRGPDRPDAKPPGVRRVALVGDSMVAAIATAEEYTLAQSLEKRLRASRLDATWAGCGSCRSPSSRTRWRSGSTGRAACTCGGKPRCARRGRACARGVGWWSRSSTSSRGRSRSRRRTRGRSPERCCACSGKPFLTLAPSFREATPHRDSRRPEEQLYYQGRIHWNDAGNALAAASVHAFLEELGGPGRTMAP